MPDIQINQYDPHVIRERHTSNQRLVDLLRNTDGAMRYHVLNTLYMLEHATSLLGDLQFTQITCLAGGVGAEAIAAKALFPGSNVLSVDSDLIRPTINQDHVRVQQAKDYGVSMLEQRIEEFMPGDHTTDLFILRHPGDFRRKWYIWEKLLPFIKEQLDAKSRNMIISVEYEADMKFINQFFQGLNWDGNPSARGINTRNYGTTAAYYDSYLCAYTP